MSRLVGRKVANQVLTPNGGGLSRMGASSGGLVVAFFARKMTQNLHDRLWEGLSNAEIQAS